MSDKSVSDCIEWTGKRHKLGYGNARHNGQPIGAHRLAYQQHHGEIPEGLHVLHRCDNPPCINPDHLFLGTHADNMADKVAKGRHDPCPGERNGRAKLTEAAVRNIRVLLKRGKAQRAIAAEHGVTQTSISRIATRKDWAWLDAE